MAVFNILKGCYILDTLEDIEYVKVFCLLLIMAHLVVVSISSNSGSSDFLFTLMQREVFFPEMMQIFQEWTT
jgi:hypothetical protein